MPSGAVVTPVQRWVLPLTLLLTELLVSSLGKGGASWGVGTRTSWPHRSRHLHHRTAPLNRWKNWRHQLPSSQVLSIGTGSPDGRLCECIQQRLGSS
jgi:hypothetical protein